MVFAALPIRRVCADSLTIADLLCECLKFQFCFRLLRPARLLHRVIHTVYPLTKFKNLAACSGHFEDAEKDQHLALLLAAMNL